MTQLKERLNHLTREEQRQLYRSLSHDNGISLGVIMNLTRTDGHRVDMNISKDEINNLIYTRVQQINNTECCVRILHQDKISLEKIDCDRLNKELDLIKQLVGYDFHKKINTYLEENLPLFESNLKLLMSGVYNLAKNSAEILLPGNEVNINVLKYSGEIPNLVYSPEKTLEYGDCVKGDFIKFNVNDNGKGFPKDKDIKENLNLGVTEKTSGSGFGLYYISLVCKALGYHLSIDSKPGDTNVSIYLPIKTNSGKSEN